MWRCMCLDLEKWNELLRQHRIETTVAFIQILVYSHKPDPERITFSVSDEANLNCA